MHVEIAPEFRPLVEEAVRSGRYASAADMIAVGLKLLAEEERKFQDLRRSIHEAIAEGGEVTPEELREALAENAERMKALGIGG